MEKFRLRVKLHDEFGEYAGYASSQEIARSFPNLLALSCVTVVNNEEGLTTEIIVSVGGLRELKDIFSVFGERQEVGLFFHEDAMNELFAEVGTYELD